LTRLT